MMRKQWAVAVTLIVTTTISASVWAQASPNPSTPQSLSSAEPSSTMASVRDGGSALPPSATQETTTVDNPYGIDALWAQGDLVTKGTLMILVLMSIATWYVTVVKLIEQTKLLRLGNKLQAKSELPVAERMAALPESPYWDLMESGKKSLVQVNLSAKLDPDTWIATAIDDAVDRVNGFLQSGMSVLATVGSTSPFVGLFGTVWGIYHALTAIGISGQASIDKVAGPVGEALIMTAIGLAVAVPAVLCYNWLLRRNRRIMDLTRLHGDNLHAELVMEAVK